MGNIAYDNREIERAYKHDYRDKWGEKMGLDDDEFKEFSKKIRAEINQQITDTKGEK